LGSGCFFEPALSANGKRSCASCHRPEKALCDQRALRFTQNLDRNSLSLLLTSRQAA
jgi:cytochrome c peroxidase